MSRLSATGTAARLPSRLHHMAWVVADQQRTRAFYEGVLGLPLVQFWIERNMVQGRELVLSHAFYGIADGGAVAFFCMADPEMHEKYKSPKLEMFNHLALKVDEATQDDILARLTAANYTNFKVEHGFCRSIYVVDPDGLIVEFTLDHPKIDEIVAEQARTADDAFRRWTEGDRTSNNIWRHEDEHAHA